MQTPLYPFKLSSSCLFILVLICHINPPSFLFKSQQISILKSKYHPYREHLSLWTSELSPLMIIYFKMVALVIVTLHSYIAFIKTHDSSPSLHIIYNSTFYNLLFLKGLFQVNSSKKLRFKLFLIEEELQDSDYKHVCGLRSLFVRRQPFLKMNSLLYGAIDKFFKNKENGYLNYYGYIMH